MNRLIALLSMIVVIAVPAIGCEVPPPEQYTAPDDLITRTKNIILAKVVSAEMQSDDYNVLYTFKTIKRLKGQTKDQFQIIGYPAIWEGANHRFNDHSDKEFWLNYGGRSSNDTDCEIHPTFSVGGTYLIFLDRPYHNKSFELIIRTHGDSKNRDKWLQYVEDRIKP